MKKDAKGVQRILLFAVHVDIENLFSEPAFIWMDSSDLIHFSQPSSPVEASYFVAGALSMIIRSVAVTKMYKQLQIDFHTILHAFLAIVGN